MQLSTIKFRLGQLFGFASLLFWSFYMAGSIYTGFLHQFTGAESRWNVYGFTKEEYLFAVRKAENEFYLSKEESACLIKKVEDSNWLPEKAETACDVKVEETASLGRFER